MARKTLLTEFRIRLRCSDNLSWQERQEILDTLKDDLKVVPFLSAQLHALLDAREVTKKLEVSVWKRSQMTIEEA